MLGELIASATGLALSTAAFGIVSTAVTLVYLRKARRALSQMPAPYRATHDGTVLKCGFRCSPFGSVSYPLARLHVSRQQIAVSSALADIAWERQQGPSLSLRPGVPGFHALVVSSEALSATIWVRDVASLRAALIRSDWDQEHT